MRPALHVCVGGGGLPVFLWRSPPAPLDFGVSRERRHVQVHGLASLWSLSSFFILCWGGRGRSLTSFSSCKESASGHILVFHRTAGLAAQLSFAFPFYALWDACEEGMPPGWLFLWEPWDCGSLRLRIHWFIPPNYLSVLPRGWVDLTKVVSVSISWGHSSVYIAKLALFCL